MPPFAWGFLVYAVAFVLPAIWMGAKTLMGWECAWWVTAIGWDALNGRGDGMAYFCIPASLVNPSVLTLAFLRWRAPGRVAWRGPLIAAATAGLVACWIILYLSKWPPHVGHVLWVAGIGVMALSRWPSKTPSNL